MGLLTLGGIPTFKKALFSFWIKVPATALAAVRSAYDINAFPQPPMAGILPFMMFGPTDGSQKQMHETSVSFGPDQTVHSHVFDSLVTHDWVDAVPATHPASHNVLIPTELIDFSPPQLLNPGFIGIDCTTGENILAFRFRYPEDVIGDMTWGAADIGGETYASDIDEWNPLSAQPFPTPPGDPPYSSEEQTLITRDLSFLMPGPDMFATLPELGAQILSLNDGVSIPSDIGIRVTANKWHHVLLLLDLNNNVTTEGVTAPGATFGQFGPVDSAPKAWLSYDDTNRTGKRLSYYAASNAGGGGPNDILSVKGREINAKVYDSDDYDTVTAVTAQYVELTQNWSEVPGPATYDFSPPAMDMQTIYIPGSTSSAQNVIMADMQVFTEYEGDFDAANSSLRRLFVDSKGKAVPISEGAARAALGKAPDIELNGTLNWQAGTNTGTAGNLDPAGTIDPYSPGPSL